MEWTIIIFVACLLLLVLAYLNKQPKDFPPGPRGVPLFGYIPFLGKNAVITITNLRKKYGNVVNVPFGRRRVIVLNDWEAIKEAFVKQGSSFSGKPQLFWQVELFSNKGIAYSYGSIWKEQRNFSLHILRDFGFGRSSMESRIMHEMEHLTNKLKDNAGDQIAINELLASPVLNIIWNIVSGKRFNETDDVLVNFAEFQGLIATTGVFSAVNSFPVLRFLDPKWNQSFRKFSAGLQKLKGYIENEVVNHETRLQENNLNDFIDVYLNEIYKRREKNGKELSPYTREHLSKTILELFVAGHMTTTATLCWALLFMANYPNIQQKVQKELDSVVAKDSYLSFSSKAIAPYTEATLLEIQRHSSIAPLIPQMTTKNTTLFGYKIPNRTTVCANIYAVHHDERYWSDPDHFRPENFLDKTETHVIKHERFIPFCVGPRTCIAESLVKMKLHLLFTSLLRRFTFETVPGEPNPSMERITGMLFTTKPFSLIVKPR